MEPDTEPHAADGAECVLVSTGDGTVAWASPSVETVLGRSAGALVGRPVHSAALGADFPDAPSASDGPVTHDLTVTTDDDERRLSVTVETVAEPTPLTVYRCRVDAPEQLALPSVLSRITDGVVAIDTEWRYTYLNDRAEEILGQSRETLLGEVIWEQFPSTRDSPVQREFERAMATQDPVSFEWRGPATETWFELRAFPSPPGLSVYFRDVTETKDRKAELGHERDLNEELLRASPVGIAVHTPDGEFVRLNERAASILGVERDELLGAVLDESMWDAVGPDGNEFPADDFPFNVVVRTGEPTRGTEMSLQRRGGERIWLSVSAAPVQADDGTLERVIVVFEDVTERKEYERQLQASEARFRSIFDNTLDALLLADDDGTYVSVNPAACDLFGLDEAELVGRNVAEFAPREYDVAAAWDGFLEAGTLRGEFPVVRPDGEVRHTDFAATANVSPGIHLSALRDISERKADERQLATQRDELQRLNELNELIREVNRAIVGETDRDAIEAAVCSSLVDSGVYPVAMATRVTADDRIQVEHIAGLQAAEFEQVRAGGPDGVDEAIQTTAMDNTPTVVTALQTDETRSTALRAAAVAHGVQSLLNIPIEYDDVVYGVVTVGATEDDAFGERERAVFLELGQLLGKAIEAIQTKKLLYASAYLELELAASAPVAPLVALNERVGGTWTLDGVVPIERGRYLLYVDSGETDTDLVEAAASDLDGIESVRVVGDGSQGRLELRVGADSVVSGLLDAGGRIRGATVERGVAQFVVDVTLDTDVRTYLDRVERRGVDLTLLAKREVERTPPAAWPGGVEEGGLTARQRTVLEAAYLSGTFDWPRRRTTGEELAASLDIASSTLHQHLRVATAKVLEQYFGAAQTTVE